MRLGQFVIVCGLVTLAVGAVSYFGGSSLGTIALRMIITLVVLQAGYFAVLAVLAAIGDRQSETRESTPAGTARRSAPDRTGQAPD